MYFVRVFRSLLRFCVAFLPRPSKSMCETSGSMLRTFPLPSGSVMVGLRGAMFSFCTGLPDRDTRTSPALARRVVDGVRPRLVSNFGVMTMRDWERGFLEGVLDIRLLEHDTLWPFGRPSSTFLAPRLARGLVFWPEVFLGNLPLPLVCFVMVLVMGSELKLEVLGAVQPEELSESLNA
uniref:Secreted protein n=1 Tax=Ixodes ricinus TaxID=34613 RepID=A0A6B0UZ94_IXORI